MTTRQTLTVVLAAGITFWALLNGLHHQTVQTSPSSTTTVTHHTTSGDITTTVITIDH